jgi:hypothetical protein
MFQATLKKALGPQRRPAPANRKGSAGPTVLRTGRQREEYDVAPLQLTNFAGFFQFLGQ